MGSRPMKGKKNLHRMITVVIRALYVRGEIFSCFINTAIGRSKTLDGIIQNGLWAPDQKQLKI